MKKFLAVILPLALLASLALGAGYTAMHQWPKGRVYNYLSAGTMGSFIENLDSALVARQSDRLLLIDKETLETQTLTDSVFDQTKLFPGLLDCAGDTVYYTCLAPESNTLAAYALNLATYEKNQIYYGSAVTNDAGFLGLDEVLGFVIQTSDLLNAAGKSYWLNQSGLHTAQDRTAELMTLDETDGYGVYEGMYKMAETDTSVFFINNFGELIRYDWEPGTFTLLSEGPVGDFFLAGNRLYYTLRSNEPVLYIADWDGQDAQEIGAVSPLCVKFADGRIFLQSADGVIYEIADNTLVPRAECGAAYWTTDGEMVYTFSPENPQVEAIALT